MNGDNVNNRSIESSTQTNKSAINYGNINNQPEDIKDWVINESRELGVDFTCLTHNQQNYIIASIMSGLENGFRSRCNYPDLRFARRRGIEKRAINNNKFGSRLDKRPLSKLSQ
ncbi:MAG TPA: hypothetical protein PKV16_08925 [Caldisericia bacterium]|nr:hypothetical protein [Caldisericia bacterium]HPF49787.1 hypothetical protein [Caldisericia bacterium]HPI84644.1 hypothetical protein [Caldisericia bacterium]HPQ93886.1 hypothetical protein [Caldisericia bacterium]HRV75691.1 hypothetical protein [Caldisericia bacterium]